MFISTYAELGVDFGRLLKNQVEANEKSSVSSPPVSRKNSLIASITSLNSLMTNTSKQDPEEVKNLGIYFINYFLTVSCLLVSWLININI